MNTQVTHRPGPFKQINKAHKPGRGKAKKQDKGKCSVKILSHRKKHDLNREERKNKLSQIRKFKREEALKNKRKIGTFHAPPIVVAIMSLDESIDPDNFLHEIKTCDEKLYVFYNSLGNCHISSPRLRQRFMFLIPDKRDLCAVMDAIKVSEVLLLIHSAGVPDEYSEILLSVIIGHALPTTIHVIQGLNELNPKRKAICRKHILKILELRFPDPKLHHGDTPQELQLLLRQIGCQKQQPVGFRDARFHMLAEQKELVDIDEVSKKGTLKVSGFIRGQPLDVNSLVHIPGWGTFQMSKVVFSGDPFAEKVNLRYSINEEPDPLKQESLQSEVEPDPMEGEQTWPTQEELDAAEMEAKTTKKRVIEGTSDYQAAWIRESDDEDEESDEDEDSESEEENGLDKKDSDHSDVENSEENNMEMDEDVDETESTSNRENENYDEDMDLNEEEKLRVRFKEERMNQMFPDEQDTPVDVSARVRYQKYRGLKNFKDSPWDPMENLPQDYARIYRFERFKQTKKKVLNSRNEEPNLDMYATLFIKDVPEALYHTVQKKNTFIVYGLLPHEQKMSVINVVIHKHPTCKTPVKSKDELIFHMGYTRFTCNPVFSEHKVGNKFKFERYLPSDVAVVASFYAPVMFPPASVVVFRQQPNGSLELVATGSVLDADPNRIIVKRIVLSGYPFKIFKRSAVVKYMFFNRDDINWFKCVELYTKCGRRGHIREALGSHGHMKCVFDRQLQSQDVVLMSLYKRVFPKWTYNLYNPAANETTLSINNTMESDVEYY